LQVLLPGLDVDWRLDVIRHFAARWKHMAHMAVTNAVVGMEVPTAARFFLPCAMPKSLKIAR
jgi:hypothetical protein